MKGNQKQRHNNINSSVALCLRSPKFVLFYRAELKELVYLALEIFDKTIIRLELIADVDNCLPRQVWE